MDRAAQADPGDFQAMPGLWKTVVITVSHGQPGQPSIRWHCVHEGADPWLAFADLSVPEEHLSPFFLKEGELAILKSWRDLLGMQGSAEGVADPSRARERERAPGSKDKGCIGER